MFKSLEVFQSAQAMARHAGKRQAVIATNIANADTPGYRARDVPDFAAVWSGDLRGRMQATRARHLHGGQNSLAVTARASNGAERSPNGNSVSLESEMVRAAQAKSQHDRALAIYRSGVTLLRAALGRR